MFNSFYIIFSILFSMLVNDEYTPFLYHLYPLYPYIYPVYRYRKSNIPLSDSPTNEQVKYAPEISDWLDPRDIFHFRLNGFCIIWSTFISCCIFFAKCPLFVFGFGTRQGRQTKALKWFQSKWRRNSSVG